MDLPFCLLVIVLMLLGLLMMYSASFPMALYSEKDSEFYLNKQIEFVLFGVGIMFFVSFFDFRYLKRFALPILGVVTILMGLVLILPSNHETHRWLSIGSFEIQVSELGKFALILAIAFWGDLFQKDMGRFRKGFLPCAVLIGLYMFLLLLEPHFSGMVIMLILGYAMMFIAGVRKRYLLLMAVVLVAAGFIYVQ